MGDSFFENPLVWLCAACVLALVLLARCGEREVYDPYAGCPYTPDTRTASGYAVARHSEAPWLGAGADDADGYALEVYEEEMVGNSLPPCVE